MKVDCFLACLLLASVVSFPAFAQEEPKKPEQPKEPKIIQLDQKKIIRVDPNNPNQKIEIKPKVEKKKTEPKISPTAKAELDKITAAYKKIDSIELSGKLSADINLGGEKQARAATFTGSFQAPNKFRHEMKEQGADDPSRDGTMVVGSTGEQVFVYRPEANEYRTADAPKERVPSSKIPRPMRDILEMQDVGLMCAIVDDAGKFLAEDTLEVTGPQEVKLDSRPHLALDFKGEKIDYRVLVDSQTHLVRQLVVDMKRMIEGAGRPDVGRFVLTFDYTKVSPGAAIKPETFAWAAPENAREVAGTMSEPEEEMVVQTAGKDAPDFTLKGTNGKEVSLKDHKGSVVVLDFWATWCGPCKVSLPGLNKIYKDLKEKGLVVYAIDMQEPKDKVQAVANQLNLDIPVLLDEKSEVANQYGVNGIPHTVVIGKDQKIVKVFVGAGNEAKIRAAVEAALAGK